MDWTVSTGCVPARRGNSWRVFALCLAALVVMAVRVHGAEIRLLTAPTALVKKLELGEIDALIDLSGAIEPGDAERLSEIVNGLDPQSFVSGADGFEAVMRLNSPGGAFKEAIEITKILKANRIQTFIEKDAECLSACAIIFMAGRYQPGFRQQEILWRKVEWPVRLGFHRPFIQGLTLDIPPDMLGDLNARDLEALFNDQFSSAFSVANQLILDMLAVDPAAWSSELLVRMLTATAPAGEGQFIYLASVDDALIWNIELINAVRAGGATKKQRYAENFWLCYNAGRAIPAYDGIWPNIATAERTLNENLRNCCGNQGVHWDSKMVADDDLAYFTRVRGWYFGCTIDYERIDAAPRITFFHDEAVVTQSRMLQRYPPGDGLGRTIRASGREGVETNPPGSGRCFVFRGNRKADDDPCERSDRRDANLGLIESYLWPSGRKTIVVRKAGRVTLNGADTRDETARRPEMDFCLRNLSTGNTFCYRTS